MPSLPEPVTRLITALGRLPGIGPRSAERVALHVVQTEPGEANELAEAVRLARERTKLCSMCGGLTENEPCDICDDARRDASLLCVVERPVDILSIEKSGTFKGRYHVLGGKIAPLEGVEPEDLRIAELENRPLGTEVLEIVLALGTDVEGDATSHYLAQRLARPGLRITRIAHGLPAGAGLEFADQLTLSKALEGRRELSP